MGLFSFTKTLCETKELHDDKELRTRYYKTSYFKAKEQIEVFANKNGLDITNVNDEHREILIQTQKFHVIISIVQVTPVETAVDIKIQSYGLFGMNLPKKTVLAIYKHLNDSLQLKGVSLHP